MSMWPGPIRGRFVSAYIHSTVILAALLGLLSVTIGCAGVSASKTSNNPSGPLAISTSSVPNGTVGVAYSYSISASGGTAPYTWSLSGENLPGGLSLNSAGKISGTPSTSGTFSFTAKVADSSTPVQTATQTYSLAISQLTGQGPRITTTSVPNAVENTPYSDPLAATGGTPPYAWTIASGSLPSGLTLSSAGDISGTPSAQGATSFTVLVTDSAKNSASAQLGITVAPPNGPSDTVTIFEVDGLTQTNRPITFGRIFKQGEIAECPQPIVAGSALSIYQADVKNRWSDGSVKFAVISFVQTLAPNSSTEITFESVPSCNNSGYLNQAQMTGFNSGNWDAQITVTPASGTAVTTSAKTMLDDTNPASDTFGDCHNDYWLQGPVVTAVIIQDCTSTSANDFGWTWNGSTMSSPVTGNASTASFHPMFICSFYPSITAVECEMMIELPWSGRVQDQLADLNFETEDSGGTLHSRWSHVGARVLTDVTASTTLNNPPAVSTFSITSASANFSSTDLGLPFCLINGSATPECGTIQSVGSSTTATVALPTGAFSISGSSLAAYINLQSSISRHRKTFWSGTAPGHIRIDHNFPYLISTKAFPNYDLTVSINPASGSYPAGKCCDYGYMGWVGTDRGEIGGFGTVNRDMSQVLEGAPLQRADLAYLYNMGTCGSSNSYCAEAWQMLTGMTAIGDMLTHAGIDTSATTQYDVIGGGGFWDNFGNVPFHWRESRTAAGGGNQSGGNCFYVSQFENKNAAGNVTLNSGSSSCLGGGDSNVPDPIDPNSATGKALSRHAHSDYQLEANYVAGTSPHTVGSALNPPYGWDVGDEGPYHWLDYAYSAYLLTGDYYYLENIYQSASLAVGFNNAGNGPPQGNGVFGYFNPDGAIVRFWAWAMQNVERAAFTAPDGSAEASYYLSMLNSNLEIQEGAQGLTGTALTPSSSQGSFTTSGTISSYDVNTANRWDWGRYTLFSTCTNTSGSCTNVSPALHQIATGQCPASGLGSTYVNTAVTSAFAETWMIWYSHAVLGEAQEMGYAQAAPVYQDIAKFLEGMVGSPNMNPYMVASYGYGVKNRPDGESTCTSGLNTDPIWTTYAGLASTFNSSAYSQTSFNTNLPNYPNYPCSDHGYSLLARAAASFLQEFGVNETDANGTYTALATWTWLNTNVPYFGNAPFVSASCTSGSDIQIKWALAPR
jgi:hypothetical protein